MKSSNYVMFGFNKLDIYDVGYLAKDCKTITDNIFEARVFNCKNADSALNYLNNDEDLNFKFHLVKVNF